MTRPPLQVNSSSIDVHHQRVAWTLTKTSSQNERIDILERLIHFPDEFIDSRGRACYRGRWVCKPQGGPSLAGGAILESEHPARYPTPPHWTPQRLRRPRQARSQEITDAGQLYKKPHEVDEGLEVDVLEVKTRKLRDLVVATGHGSWNAWCNGAHGDAVLAWQWALKRKSNLVTCAFFDGRDEMREWYAVKRLLAYRPLVVP